MGRLTFKRGYYAVFLEEGKRYVRRDGKISGEIHKSDYKFSHLFIDKENEVLYTSSGHNLFVGHENFDLVKECFNGK